MWRFVFVLQFYCLLALYTYLGLTPHPESSMPVMMNDLIMHFGGYVIAGISISFARPFWPIWQRAAFLIGYSIAIELAQHFHPPRTFSAADIVANSGGVLVGLGVVMVLLKYQPLFRKCLYYR